MDWTELREASASLLTVLRKQSADDVGKSFSALQEGGKSDGRRQRLGRPDCQTAISDALKDVGAAFQIALDRPQLCSGPMLGLPSLEGALSIDADDDAVAPDTQEFLRQVAAALVDGREVPCCSWSAADQVPLEDRWLLSNGLEELYNGRSLDEVLPCFIDHRGWSNPRSRQPPVSPALCELRSSALTRVRDLLAAGLVMPKAYTTSSLPWFRVSNRSLAPAADVLRYCVVAFHLSPSVVEAWAGLMDALCIPLLSDAVSVSTFTKWQEPLLQDFNQVVLRYVEGQDSGTAQATQRPEFSRHSRSSNLGRISASGASVKRINRANSSFHTESTLPSRRTASRSAKDTAIELQPGVTHNFLVNTYLQMVGREIIYRAGVLVPILSQMPDAVPPIAIYRVFMQPYLRALRCAIEALMDKLGENIAAFVSERVPADEAKQYQRVYIIDGTRPRANPHFMLSKRSPISILTSIHDDGSNFIHGLADVFTPWDPALAVSHCKMLRRLVDGIFVEQGADVMRVVDVYISAMVKELETSGEEEDVEGMDVEMDSWPMVKGETADDPLLEKGVRPWNKPRRIHNQHQRSIAVISQHLWRITRTPSVLHALMAMSCLNAMQTLMNVLVRAFQESSNPMFNQQGSPLAPFYALTGALCVKRRLTNMGTALELPLHDLNYHNFTTKFAHVLNQAQYVVKRVKKQLVQSHIQLFAETICAEVESTPWNSHRKPQAPWAQGASPAVRHWRFALLTMLHRLVSICSLEVTETVFGTVLMQSAADLGLRYKRHRPSWQWRERYRSDVLHIVSTVIGLSAVIEVTDKQQIYTGELISVTSEIQPARCHLSVLDTVAYSMAMRAVLLVCDASDLTAHVDASGFKDLAADQAMLAAEAAQRGLPGVHVWDWVPKQALDSWQRAFASMDLTSPLNPMQLFDLQETSDPEIWTAMMQSMLRRSSAAEIIQVVYQRPELQRPPAGMPADAEREAARSLLLQLVLEWPLLQASAECGRLQDGYAEEVASVGFEVPVRPAADKRDEGTDEALLEDFLRRGESEYELLMQDAAATSGLLSAHLPRSTEAHSVGHSPKVSISPADCASARAADDSAPAADESCALRAGRSVTFALSPSQASQI